MNEVVKSWLKMSRRELDDIFHAARAHSPRSGSARGTVIVPGAVANVSAWLASTFVWKGKVFECDARAGKGSVINRITPFGFRGVAGKVYRGASWLDDRQSIIIDYSQTSFVARRVRDEIREVQPGVFLGKVWWRHTRLFDFALVQPTQETDH